MPIPYTNANGKTYYLYLGTTKTGKPKYYFSMESNGALAEYLNYPHFDTDDCFWFSTDPPLPHQRDHTERQQLLMDDIMAHDAWVVSGSLCGWGDSRGLLVIPG